MVIISSCPHNVCSRRNGAYLLLPSQCMFKTIWCLSPPALTMYVQDDMVLISFCPHKCMFKTKWCLSHPALTNVCSRRNGAYLILPSQMYVQGEIVLISSCPHKCMFNAKVCLSPPAFSMYVQGEMVLISSCPDKYIWIMGCTSPHGRNRNKCNIDDVTFSLDIVKGKLDSAEANRDPRSFLNDFPMAQAAQDLCPTGMKFGAQDMEWFYTYGRSGKPAMILQMYFLFFK